MNVKLDEFYDLRSDGLQYILYFKDKPIAYSSTIAQMVKSFRRRKYMKNNCRSLNCLVDHIKRVDAYVVSMLDENKELR